MSGSREVNLIIFITPMSGSKSVTSFVCYFFHFSRPLELRLAFDTAERNGKFGCIQCQRSKESRTRGRREKNIPLQEDRKIIVKGKVIPRSFLKTKGGEFYVEAEERRKADSCKNW